MIDLTDSDCPPVPDAGNVPEVAEQPASDPDASDKARRLRELVDDHYDFVWRSLRYLGLSDADAEDGAQQVMCVLARRLGDVMPGAERPFLFSTAANVAATVRRTQRRHPETAADDLDSLAAATPSGEDLLEERRAHEALQRIIQAMPVDLRLVFVLYEIEEMTTPEIAATIGVPAGTIASRLRRARETFQAIVKRWHAAQRARGEGT
jgi:RNA polymerase sigma-70 factor (ECF subfamily)